jgi:aminoglycoside phosphotransferase (APT) family kinase protein
MGRRRRWTDWQALRDEVESALRSCAEFPASVRINGRLNRMEQGLNHQNYWFRLKADGPLPSDPDMAYVLRSAGMEVDGASYEETVARIKREAMTLRALASQKFEFSAPRFVCLIRCAGGSATGLIETAVHGLSLDLCKKEPSRRQFVIEAIARVAAAVHQVGMDSFYFLPHQRDSATHVLAELNERCPELIGHDPDAAAAAGWIRGHLPEGRPSVLLHGDLLPQNILWDFETEQLGVIDWEYAQIGDAAYDLAIVTRGRGKLFGSPNGLRQIVDAYRRARGVLVEAADVINHELLLVLRWLEESVRAEHEGRREGHPPAHYKIQIRAILRRAKSLEAQ